MASLSELAFGEFYQRHRQALWSYVYRVIGNGADADDIVQEAFVRLLNADVTASSDEDLRRYLFRIASNAITDRWRRSRREQPVAASTEAPARISAAVDLDVAATFARLAPRERALLWLAYVEEHDHAAIAESLRVKRGSVKVLLSRARGRLRDLLKQRGLARVV